PPPNPTLFPYTTLFRSQAGKRIQVIADKKGIIARSSRGDRRLIGVLQVRDGAAHDYSIDGCADGLTANLTGDVEAIRGGVHRTRSEEHTSELQSLAYLV